MKKSVKYVVLALAVFGLLSILSAAALAETRPVAKGEEHHAMMMKQIEDTRSQINQDNTKINRLEAEMDETHTMGQSSEWKPLFPHLTTKYGY